MADVAIDVRQADDPPMVCVACGRRATDTVSRQFTWSSMPRFFIGPPALASMLYWMNRRTMQMRVPLCSKHRNVFASQEFSIFIAPVLLILLMFGGFGLGAFITVQFKTPWGIGIAAAGIVVGFVAAAAWMLLVNGRAIRPSRIDDHGMLLANVHPGFKRAVETGDAGASQTAQMSAFDPFEQSSSGRPLSGKPPRRPGGTNAGANAGLRPGDPRPDQAPDFGGLPPDLGPGGGGTSASPSSAPMRRSPEPGPRGSGMPGWIWIVIGLGVGMPLLVCCGGCGLQFGLGGLAFLGAAKDVAEKKQQQEFQRHQRDFRERLNRQNSGPQPRPNQPEGEPRISPPHSIDQALEYVRSDDEKTQELGAIYLLRQRPDPARARDVATGLQPLTKSNNRRISAPANLAVSKWAAFVPPPDVELVAGEPVDLMANLNPRLGTIRGTVEVADGALLLKQSFPSIYRFPVELPQNYRVELEVTRTQGQEALLILPIYSGRRFAVSIDGHSHAGFLTGIVQLEGRNLDQGENPTRIKGLTLQNDEPAVIEVTVLDQRILVEVDDELLIDFTEPQLISGVDGRWSGGEGYLTIGAWQAEYKISRLTLTKLTPGEAPSDVPAPQGEFDRRLAMLGRNQSVDASLKALAEMEVDPERQAEVVAALDAQFPAHRDAAMRAMKVWGVGAALPGVIETATKEAFGPQALAIEVLGQSRDPAALAALTELLNRPFGDGENAKKQLIEMGREAGEAAVLSGLNMEGRRGDRSRAILEAYATPPEILTSQSIADLSSEHANVRKRALSRLGDPATAVIEERREETLALLQPMAQAADRDAKNRAIRALIHWIEEDDVATLRKLAASQDDAVRLPALRRLIVMNDSAGVQLLAAALANPQSQGRMRGFLRDMGAEAEPALLALLAANNQTLLTIALQELGRVGTAESIERLEAFGKRALRAQNASLIAETKRTIEAIQKRQGM